MASPMTWKRRRLNDSHATLSKPFVSPLRTSQTGRAPLRQNNDAANVAYKPSMLAHTIKTTPLSTTAVMNTPKTPNFYSMKSTPTRKRNVSTIAPNHISAAELAVQKALTSLEAQIRQLRSEINALTQGSQLHSSTSNVDLEDLAQRWKLASQTAAEELFESARERVYRMGGVASWRESEKKKYEWGDGFRGLGRGEEEDDRDCEFDDEGEELPEEEQEWRKKEKKRVRREINEANDVEEDVKAEMEEEKKKSMLIHESSDDHSFTMDMMLRSFNIELDVIGYDKVAQKWVI